MADKQQLSVEDVRAIADLARLELSDTDIEKYAQQLSQILDYFQLLQEVDTSDVSPTASVLPLRSVMREDNPAPALDPNDAIANAPISEANQFKVSAVLGDA